MLSILPAHVSSASTVAADCGSIQILSEQLTAREAETYCAYAVAEREKVERFWGATWKLPIGLAAFRDLYDGKTYESVYGKRLEMLEKEWRTALQ